MSNAELRFALQQSVTLMIAYSVGAAASAIAIYPTSAILAGVWVAIVVITVTVTVMWVRSLKGWKDGIDT